MSKLATIAPRLAAARDGIRAYEMRHIRRCSCAEGWRIIGHEYSFGSCFDRLESAKAARDRLDRRGEL